MKSRYTRTQSALLGNGRAAGNSRWRLRSVPSPFLSLPPRTPSVPRHFSLPEAQMDRFILCLSLGYPTEIEELQMLQRLADGVTVTDLQPLPWQMCRITPAVRSVKVENSLQQYILNLVRATRQDEEITGQSSWYRSFTTSNSGSSFSY